MKFRFNKELFEDDTLKPILLCPKNHVKRGDEYNE
ncbi:hypothetical protein SAMN05443246_5975 [Paenibacillus sp. GP183]|nr:hypothetical protein SAMN05443246_5975 [Paenibacillus sp. GP183]